MTEPREPEAVPEGEAAAPEEQPTTPTSPSTGNWYPVNTQPAPEPETDTVPEEVGEERADRHEGPSEESEPEPAEEPTTEEPEPAEEPPSESEPEPAAEEEPAPAPVPEEVGEERADRHEGPSESEPEPAEEPPAEPAAAEEPEDEVDENEDPTVSLPGPDFAMPAAAEATERVDVGEDRPTSASTPPADAIFRQPSPTSSASPEPTTLEPLSEEEQRLAAERAARRDARAAALAAPAPEPVAPPKPVVIHKRTNDKFWGSLGLFLLRIVLAGIFTIRGLNILTDIPAAQAEFATTILADYPPGPQAMAIVTGVASLLIALSLVLGLLTRVAGLGIALIAGGALALVYWSPSWSPFQAGQPGFLGEYQLVLAALGILLLCIGGGGWSLDRSFRAGRERDKRERAAETG